MPKTLEVVLIEKPKTQNVRNRRLRAVLKLIKANPKHWDQRWWHCNSSHCFAGFAELLAADLPAKTNTKQNRCTCIGVPMAALVDGEYDFMTEAEQRANLYLGLTASQSNNLFDGDNSLEDLEDKVREICDSFYDPDEVFTYLR